MNQQAHLFMAHANYLPDCDPQHIMAYWQKHPLYTQGLSAKLLERWSVHAQLPSRAQSLERQDMQSDYIKETLAKDIASGFLVFDEAQERNATTQCQDGTWW